MITETSNKILKLAHDFGHVTANQIVKTLNISNVAAHKQLKKIVSQGKLQKVGTPPKVFYIPAVNTNQQSGALVGNVRGYEVIRQI